MIKYIGMFLSLLVIVTSCQKLEDTYKDYAGDGEIRYLGMCKDVTVSSGWKRLVVKWTNSVDPVVDKIKVEWTCDGVSKDVVLDKGTTEYNIPDLTDGTYTVTVCSLDKDANPSLETTVYGRPYTASHELVQSFTRLISKHFFVGDHLVLFFVGWQDGVKSATLKYTKKDGNVDSLAITQDLVDAKYYLLSDELDLTKPIELYRVGKIAGCDDLITFDPYVLTSEKTYSADFKEFLKSKYGTTGTVLNASGDVQDGWVNKQTELDIDASLTSFEDILNFPNLKTLVLGKHRYLLDEAINDATRGQFTVYDPECSNFVLKVAHQLLGLNVERYNKHYSVLSPQSFIKEMGKPTLPDLNYLNLTGLKFTVSPEDEEGYNSHLEYLTDGNSSSCWLPLTMSSMTSYTLTLDLKSVKHLKGLKFVQKHFGSYDSDQALAPNIIKIQTSKNLGAWSDVTYLEDNTLGTSTGEINIIPFVEGGVDTQYIRIIVGSQYYHGFYDVTFAEVGLY